MKRGPIRERKYDLLINGLGYMVAGGGKASAPLWSVSPIAGELGGPPPQGDVKEELLTWHYGAGFGHLNIPGCYSYATNMNATQPGIITMGPLVTSITLGGTASVSDFFETNNTLYALGGRYCKSINVTTDAVGAAAGDATGKDFGVSTVATEAIEYEGNILIGFSSDTPIQKFSSGTTWSNIDSDTGSATLFRSKYWAKDYLDSYGWRLWAGYSTAYVKVLTASADPLRAGQWAANPITIGDTGRAITSMTSTDSMIWVGKTDGLYPLDYAGRTPNVLRSVSMFNDTDNARKLLADGNTVYIPHVMGYLAYDRNSGKITSIQPFARTGNTSAIYGTVTAQVRLGSWHYIAVSNGTDSYILQGRHPEEGDSLPSGWMGPMIWHPIVKMANTRIDCMHITTLSSPARLYFGKTVGSTYDIAYIKIAKSGDQLAESGLTYAASGSIFFSPLTFRERGTPKELIGFDIENEGFSASSYIDLYLSLDGGSYTQWSTSATTAGRARLTLPSSGSWRANSTYIELRATNASSSTTIKIKPVTARASLRPTIQDLITTTLLCNDEVKCRDGSEERRAGQTMLTELNALNSGAPITLVDYWTGEARSRTVVVESGGVKETMVAQTGNDPAGYGAQVVMRVIS